MANDSQIRIGMDLDTSGIERSTARAEKAVEQLRSRTASRMGSGGAEAGGAWGSEAADAISRRAPMIFAATASLARVASAALSSAGADQMAGYLDSAVQGSMQLGAVLAPLGKEAMIAGAGLGALAGVLTRYFQGAKAAREETEKLVEAARAAAAEDLVGGMRTQRTQSRLANADGADEIRKRIQAMQDREAELTRLIDTNLATPAQMRERREIREEMPGWQSALSRADLSAESRDTYERAEKRREEIARQTQDAQRRAAELANLGQTGITADDRHAIAMAGTEKASERVALLEERAKRLEAELKGAISQGGGDKGWDGVNTAREAVRSNAVELELARQAAETEKTRKPKKFVFPTLVRPGSADALQSKGWGAVSEPWAGFDRLLGSQIALGSTSGGQNNTMETLSREQRDLLRLIADAFRPGRPAPVAVYGR